MTFDKSNLSNLKIRVNTPEESERAQRAFFALGFEWFRGGNFTNYKEPRHLKDVVWLFIDDEITGIAPRINYTWVDSYYGISSHVEITLIDLEALATKHKYQSLEFVDMNQVILGRNTCLAATENDPNIKAGAKVLTALKR